MQGVDQVVPVDVYAPGCPPAPETLIHAITTLHRIIESGELMQRRAITGQGAAVNIEQHEAAPVALTRSKRHLGVGEPTAGGRR